jgi:hypothetical protein
MAQVIANIVFVLGLKGYVRLQKVPWGRYVHQISRAYPKQLFLRDELVLLNLNSYSKQVSIWEQLEEIKKISAAYPFEEFLKSLRNNPFIDVQKLTSMQLGMIYAGSCVLGYHLYIAKAAR